jgi:peptide deformylase
MTAQEITYMGNPILREVCEEVTDILGTEIQQLIDDLIDSLNNSTTPWVWIAAPQIGVNKCICIIHSRATPNYPDLQDRGPEAMINPSIISHGDEILQDREGCLSIPGIRAKVPRRKDIEIQYTDRHNHNQKQTMRLWDFTARIFQHEYDHLNGVLFLDRVTDADSLMMYDEFVKRALGK